MKILKKLPVVFMIMALLAASIQVNVKEVEAAKPKVSAESAIVMDVQSGSILYQKNMNKKEYPASITKIMTALVAIENSTMSEIVKYSRNAVTNLEYNASNIEIKPGEELTMEDSLYAIMLMSANEACNGVAEHIAGSIDKFVDMMNKKAKSIGCTGTHFANANGLWQKNHYTTAHDMALISREAYKNPDFAKITGTKRYNVGKTNKTKYKRGLYNHHGMLYASKFPQYLYEYCVGGKTGYTVKCKYTLVTFAKKGNMTLVSVVMRVPKSPYETPNEYSDSTKLLNYGFENFSRISIQDDATKEINSKYLFTKFSPFFNSSTSSLKIDDNAGVVLPKGVKITDTKKNVEYYDAPSVTSDGKKIIGKITYTYDGLNVGGSNIYYEKSSSPTLSDSIDVNEWLKDSVEKANEDPFPWKLVIILCAVAVVAIGVAIVVIFWIKRSKDERARRNRYKRSRRRLKRHEKKGF